MGRVHPVLRGPGIQPYRARCDVAEGRTRRINGAGNPTEDGTCVRDYVHSTDLEPLCNLGSDGISVRQIMTAMPEVARTDFVPDLDPRRPADPALTWPPATWPPATSTGSCGEPAPTWSPAHGTHTRPQ